jgi:hypothetical protein
MEGSYYQKPFNLLQKIKKSVLKISRLDMHIMQITLETGSTLASGVLGTAG